MSSDKRKLLPSDLERMRVPKRYWMAKFDLLSETGDPSVKEFIGKYIDNIQDMKTNGVGVIFHGKNGIGKSCASVVLAKEYRARGNTVLFIEASELKEMVIQKRMFDEAESYFDRAKEVGVLVLDDFGKGIMDSTGFGASLFDTLIRSRNSKKLVTIITANLSPDRWKDELELKLSTMSSLRECAVPFLVEGKVLRESATNIVGGILGLS